MIPFYPVAIAVWFVLDLYRDSGEPTVSLIRPLIAAVVIAALIQIVVTLLARDRDRGALLAAMLIALLLQKVLGLFGMTIFLLALTIPGLRAIRRHVPPPGIRWDVATRVFNAIGSALVAITLLSIVAMGMLALPPSIGTARADTSPDNAPDIYLILLDGHPRWDTIESWGADGKTFIDDLSALGLQASMASRSNYNITQLSLPSMLEMAPIGTEAESRALSNVGQARELYERLNRARALDLLHAAGYEVVTVPLGFARTELHSADRFLDDGSIEAFEQDLLVDTALQRFVPRALRSVFADQRRLRLDDSMDDVIRLAAERADHPRFLFIHLSLPHLPALFTRDGGPVDGSSCVTLTCVSDFSGRPQLPSEAIAGVLGNMTYIDRWAIEAVRAITSDSQRPPVIVVFSDHGSRYDPNDRHEMFRNLIASSTPGHPGLFSDDITLVEIMPTLLGTYLGVSIPTPDVSSYWLDIDAVHSKGMFALELMPPIDVTSPPVN